MNNFPRDPHRLHIWRANCGLENKKFNYCAALCKVRYIFSIFILNHELMEKKLKISVVPTIFEELVIQQKLKRNINVKKFFNVLKNFQYLLRKKLICLAQKRQGSYT
ncbi:hypothetical protein PUN28_008211 [Cardiocondyla obscurior]|uniref:Uncharacterized protein n=1 Tax=Cardiocondyla obscurior TaxID=286306 RepID=A0AAW2FWN2_9HYME